jgi:hypothetical protein
MKNELNNTNLDVVWSVCLVDALLFTRMKYLWKERKIHRGFVEKFGDVRLRDLSTDKLTLFIYLRKRFIILDCWLPLTIRYKDTKTNTNKTNGSKTRFKIGDKVYLLDDRNIHSLLQ